MVVDYSGSNRGDAVRGDPAGALQHGEERMMTVIIMVIMMMVAAAAGFFVGIAYGQEHREE